MKDIFSKTIFKQGSYNEFKNFALFIKFMKGYSVLNAALVYCQRPGAVWVETEAGWNRRGRFIKPNARPLVILQPFSPVNFVYELEDTYGKEFKLLKKVYDLPLEVFDSVNLDSVKRVLAVKHIAYTEAPLGSRLSGYITALEQPSVVEINEKGKITNVTLRYGLTVNANKPVSSRFTTIIHELGHLFCGHLPLIEGAPNRETINLDRSGLSQNEMETEAETVVKLVCMRLNIEYDENEYLSQYRRNGKSPEINLQVVVNAVDKILPLLKEVGIYAKN